MPISSWSTTASSNDVADSASGITWTEGMAPGQVNDSSRAMMAETKKWTLNPTVMTGGTLSLNNASDNFAATIQNTGGSGAATLSISAATSHAASATIRSGNGIVLNNASNNFACTIANIGSSGAGLVYVDSSMKVGGTSLLVGATAFGKTVFGASVAGVELEMASNAGTAQFTKGVTGLKSAAIFYDRGAVVGSIGYSDTATIYNTSSDYRLKTNVRDMTGSGAFIDALRPRQGNWKADGTAFAGFLAHELQEVSPASVTGEKDGEAMQAIDAGTPEIIANIVAEVQALRQRVAELEA